MMIIIDSGDDDHRELMMIIRVILISDHNQIIVFGSFEHKQFFKGLSKI